MSENQLRLAKFLPAFIFVLVATTCVMAGWLVGTTVGRSFPDIWVDTSFYTGDSSSVAAGQAGISGGLSGLILAGFLSFASFGLVIGLAWRRRYPNLKFKHWLYLLLGWMFIPISVIFFMLCSLVL